MVAWRVACLSACMAACAHQAPFRPPDLDPGERRLAYEETARVYRVENGLTLVFLPDANTNLVKVDVRYDVGAAEDPLGRGGLAHLVEHMMFAARPHGAGGPSLGDEIGALSLYYNAFTTWDETQYTSVGLKEHLPALLALEARRLQARCEWFDEDSLAREREVVRNELRQRDGVASRMIQGVLGAVYGAQHPYARPIGGSDGELASATVPDVCAFVEAHYAPERALIVVTGAVDPAQASRVAGSLFGAIPARASSPRTILPPVALHGGFTRSRLDVDEATAFITFRASPLDDAERPLTRLLTAVLQQRLGVLERELDEVSSIDVVPLGGTRQPLTAIVVSVKDPARLGGVVDRVFATWEAYVRGLGSQRHWFDPDAIQVEALRERQRHAILAGLEPFFSRGDLFADHLQYGHDELFVIHELKALEGASGADLGKLAARSFRRADSHIVYVLPGPAARTRRARAPLSYQRKDRDLQEWKVVVDEAEATRALPVPPARAAAPVELVLENGLRVLLWPGLAYPLVDIRLVFPAGARDDPPDRKVAEMAAQLLEHDYQRDYAVDDVDDIVTVERMGGVVTRRVEDDATTFRITGLGAHADGLLWKLNWLVESGIYDADRLRLVRQAAAAGDTRLARVQVERRRRVQERLYGRDHPYARTVPAGALARLEADDLEGFRRRRYRARGATLIVAGRFDPAAMERRIRKLFGAWDGAAPPPPSPAPGRAAGRAGRPLLFTDEDAALVSVEVGFTLSPGYARDRAARLVLREILELRMARLRSTLGSTYGISVDLLSRAGPGVMRLAGSVDPERAGETLAALLGSLDELRRGEGLTADFVRARRMVLRRLLAEAVDSGSVADLLEALSIHSLPLGHVEALQRGVAALRPEQLQKTIAAELGADRAVIVVEGPHAACQAAFRQVGMVPDTF
jgi:zinc protease